MDKKIMMQNGFDYIALGHIHKPEIFGERMAYAGSLEPLDKNETGERGYILGEIEKTGDTSSIRISFVPNSIRQYYKLEVPVEPGITNGEVQDMIRSKIAEYGLKNMYSFLLTGIRDADIAFRKEDIMKLGNVVDVEDNTIPDYDFDALYLENKDNIIGQFIQRIREDAGQDAIAQKALYYGMEALLGARL
jgi:exonuclease SbcD